MKNEIFIACLKEYNTNIKSPYWDKLAKKFDLYGGNGEKLRSAFKNERRKRGIPPKGKNSETNVLGNEDIEYMETFSIKNDGKMYSDKVIAIHEEDKKNPEKLLELHGFNPETWSVFHCTNNLWHAQRKNDQGHLLMYQSKLTARPKKLEGITFDDIEKFFKKFKPLNVSAQSKPSHYDKDGLMLEVDIADIHIGGKPFGRDLGEDIKERFIRLIDDVYNRAKTQPKFAKVLLVGLGDIFHFDNIKNTTVYGTVMETNGMDYSEIFDLGVEMLVYAIDSLSRLAPLEFIFLHGNHDKTFSFFLAKVLETHYKDDKNILVDSKTLPRKFRLFGNSLVGFAHGDMAKARMPSWLHLEARKEWSLSKSVEVHAGHWHSQTTIEKNGMVIRYVPSIANIDQWHYEKGFIGSKKATVSFVWTKNNGLKEMWFHNA